jgi:hypothetical protein
MDRAEERTYLALDLPEHAVLDLLVRERVRQELIAGEQILVDQHGSASRGEP